MSETVQLKDFIELNYTGRLADGTIYDTTEEKVAKENGFFNDKAKFGPVIICLGEKQILPGLDDKLVGTEINVVHKISLSPEEAFGKRDVKRIKIVPISNFKDQKVYPQPGLQVNIDGEVGVVTRVSGGRVMVNFNHPLAGKDVIYEVKILRKITDKKEQLESYLTAILGIPEGKLKIELNGEMAEAKMPFDLPQPVADALSRKAIEVTGLKEIKFTKNEAEKKEIKKENTK